MTPSPKLKWHVFHLNGFSQLQSAPGGSAAKSWFLCSVSSFRLFPPFSWLSPGGSPVAICAHYFKHCQAGSSPEVFSSCPLCLPLLDPMQNSVGGPDIWYCSWVFKNTLRSHTPVDFNVLESKTGLQPFIFREQFTRIPFLICCTCVLVCLCAYVSICLCMWKPEGGVKSLLQPLSVSQGESVS